MSKKIYLSGPISMCPIDEARRRFDIYEAKIRKDYPDAEIYNPMKFCHYDESKQWKDYMHTCLLHLEKCDTIVMLPEWEQSNGANCELWYARGLGLDVYSVWGNGEIHRGAINYDM